MGDGCRIAEPSQQMARSEERSLAGESHGADAMRSARCQWKGGGVTESDVRIAALGAGCGLGPLSRTQLAPIVARRCAVRCGAGHSAGIPSTVADPRFPSNGAIVALRALSGVQCAANARRAVRVLRHKLRAVPLAAPPSALHGSQCPRLRTRFSTWELLWPCSGMLRKR